MKVEGLVREPRCIVCLDLHIIRSSLLVLQYIFRRSLLAVVLPSLFRRHHPRIIDISVVESSVLQASTLGAFLDPACAWISHPFKVFSPKLQISCSFLTLPLLELVWALPFRLASPSRRVQHFCEGGVV